MAGQPQTGQSADAADLLRRHCMFEAAERVAGAGLDLDEDSGLLVSADQIQFAVATPPVALKDPPAQGVQVIDGNLLAESSELLSAEGRHEGQRQPGL